MSFNYSQFADEIKRYSRELADQILEPDGVHQHQPGSKYAGWICPNCNSGSGDKGTGITEKEGLFSCWSCGFKGDILNLIGLKYGLSDAMEIARKAAELLNIDLDSYNGERIILHNKIHNKKEQTEPPQVSYQAFIDEAATHIEETDYHRGISLETLKRFKVGFIKEYRHTDKQVTPAPALIIPTSEYSYIARRTDTDEPREKARKRGSIHTFNSEALYNTTSPVIFITEGELDALSIIDAGGEAVGLGGAGSVRRFISEIEQNGKKPVAPLVIIADNDKPKEGEEDKPTPGKAAADLLAAELKRLGVKYYYEGIHLFEDDIKDANEAYIKNRATFTALVRAMGEMPAAEARQQAEEYRKEYSIAAHTTDFLSKIKREYTAPIKTGWQSLDTLLDGGLYQGLYVIGALSSMGKTTYTLQMADQVAASGTDALIISLEQSRDELMAKTISRYTYLIESEKAKPNTHNAKTTRGILDGSRYIGYSKDESRLIEQALERYSETTAPHLFIIEGRGSIGTKDIREAIETHKRITGKAPVVFIDYLQILQPADERSSDKQNADRAVSDLYRIARDFKTPVIAISSFNRESYNRPASMSSFKESGGIEYGADFVIALQAAGLEDKETKTALANNAAKVAKTKRARERELEVKILKNRNGRTGVSYTTKYRTLFNLCEDSGIEDEDESEEKPKRIKL